MRLLKAVCLLILASLPAAGWAADPKPLAQLGAVEQAMKDAAAQRDELRRQARTLAADLADLRLQSMKAAQAAQGEEEAVAGLDRHLRQLDGDIRQRAAALERQQAHLALVLSALLRLARQPPEALAGFHQSPGESVRAGILLKSSVAPLEEEARRLRYDMETLAALQAQAVQERDRRGAALQRLAADRRALEAVIGRKRGLKRQATEQSEEADRNAAALAARAQDLRDLIAALDKARKRRAPAVLTAKQLGTLPFPARGEIVQHFGDPTSGAGPSKGITLATLPRAQVVSTYEGEIVFAGPFQHFGQVLIIDHGGGYHTLLAGLAQIDCIIGQRVLSGEPVGIMGAGAGGPPTLYVELRQNGRPINPLPWMTAHVNKVSG